MLAFASLSGIDRVSQKLRKEVSGNLAVLVINEHGPVPVQWSPLKRTKWQLSTGVKRQNRSRNQRLRQLSLPFRCKDTGQLSRTKVGQSLGVDLILFTYLSGRGKLKWVFREQRERECVSRCEHSSGCNFDWLAAWVGSRFISYFRAPRLHINPYDDTYCPARDLAIKIFRIPNGTCVSWILEGDTSSICSFKIIYCTGSDTHWTSATGS